MSRKVYHSMRPLLDRGALFSICQGVRGVGKSFPMLIRTMCRVQRCHRSVLWLRRTGEDIDTWIHTFGSDKWQKAAKIAGVDMERLRRRGNIIWYNTGRYLKPEWVRMIRAHALVDWNNLRDTDDPREELIVLDEAFATMEKRNRYIGNEVHDFLDIFASMYREGENDIRALIMGNEETANNPYFDYLGLARPGIEEGIVMLTPKNGKQFPQKYGLVAYERALKHDEDNALNAVTAGTDYGGFLHGDSKGIDRGLLAPIPKQRRFYVSADFGTPVSFWVSGDMMYCSAALRGCGYTIRPGIDGNRDTLPLTPRIRKLLVLLSERYRANKIRFESPEAYEAGMHAISKMLSK